jgi:transposase-like protein
VFDGKFLFGRKYTLGILYDATTDKPITACVMKSECYKYIHPWLQDLKSNGLNPISITLDGNKGSCKAFSDAFDGIRIQRCLFHVCMQLGMWLRHKPKILLAIELKNILDMLNSAYTKEQLQLFLHAYTKLKTDRAEDLKCLDTKDKVESDLAKCFSLLDNSLKYLDPFLIDGNIARTTSPLEGYNKKIQDIRGFRHNGLTKDHLVKFIIHKIHHDLTR